MNVLIVDDNATNRKLLHVTLEADGLNIIEAADGVEALKALAQEPIDVVISDILMPNMDGYRLCYEIRRIDKLKLLPFIFYTSTYTSPADEKLARDLGADKFIKKPASITAILDALYELTQEDKYDEPRKVKPLLELELMKEYSERLVAKLEEKNIELEETRETLRKANEELEQRVQQRTTQLEAANKELEAFSHSVAHDLQSPLRAIDGFSKALQAECAGRLPPPGMEYLGRILNNVQRMRQFIDHLLDLARLGSLELVSRPVNLSDMATEITAELHRSQPERAVEFRVAPDLVAPGDKVLLRAMLENLLGNAWKFTGKTKRARIEFGLKQDGAAPAYFVRDNGAGFEMAYADKLFKPFQRLHTASEFPGSGIGLATAHRIITRHGGRIWAEGEPDKGATFYFTL